MLHSNPKMLARISKIIFTILKDSLAVLLLFCLQFPSYKREVFDFSIATSSQAFQIAISFAKSSFAAHHQSNDLNVNVRWIFHVIAQVHHLFVRKYGSYLRASPVKLNTFPQLLIFSYLTLFLVNANERSRDGSSCGLSTLMLKLCKGFKILNCS